MKSILSAPALKHVKREPPAKLSSTSSNSETMKTGVTNTAGSGIIMFSEEDAEKERKKERKKKRDNRKQSQAVPTPD